MFLLIILLYSGHIERILVDKNVKKNYSYKVRGGKESVKNVDHSLMHLIPNMFNMENFNYLNPLHK